MSQHAWARSSARVTVYLQHPPHESVGQARTWERPLIRSRPGSVHRKRQFFSCSPRQEDQTQPKNGRSRYDDTVQTRLAHRARQKQADKVGQYSDIDETGLIDMLGILCRPSQLCSDEARRQNIPHATEGFVEARHIYYASYK